MSGSDRSLFPSSGGSSRRSGGPRRKVSAKTESESIPTGEEPTTMSSAEEVEALKSQLAESQQHLQECQARIAELQSQLQQVSTHRDELQKALAQLQALADERAKTIQELQSRKEQLKPQPQAPLAHTAKKIMNRPIFDNVSATDEKMPPYLLD
ncbi:MAG: hypothetical protein Q6K80_04950 [Thermostichus sp. DG_1_6_bins_120]